MKNLQCYLMLALILISCASSDDSSGNQDSVITPSVWVENTNFPGIERDDSIGFAIDGVGYVGTGKGGGVHKDFYKYMPDTDSWSQIGGINMDGSSYSDLWKYNHIMDIWEEMVSFPGNIRSYAVCFWYEDKGYVCTGRDENAETINEFWEYDATTNAWTELEEPAFGKIRGTAIF